MKGVWHDPRDPRSVSLNVSYQKKQEYMWFRGEDLNSFEILGLLLSEGVGHVPRMTQELCLEVGIRMVSEIKGIL